MILIADSGSTKTDWRLIDGTEVRSMSTKGINPFHSNENEIKEELEKLDLVEHKERIMEIFFYGSGVANESMKDVIRRGLQQRIGTHPHICVEDDLLGVARALFKLENGIACILGTGSNSCLYQDGMISDKVPALGYSLGDEGSGTDIGKRLLNALLKRNLSEHLRKAIISEEELSIDQILENVYQKPHANRYLASLTRIARKYIDHMEIQSIVEEAFDDFIRKNISKYHSFKTYKIGFAGSVAYHFSNILTEMLQKHGLKYSQIIASPIDGLVEFHMQVASGKITGTESITESP
ncbi:MAG: hypothetical protein KAT15_28290, partial [Bacteroidales bacterium]|nr:hypothetical protein [Bacteroidales bacterium]